MKSILKKPKKNVKIELIQITLLRVEESFFEAKLSLKLSWMQEKLEDFIPSVSAFESDQYWSPAITITNYFEDMVTYSNLEVDLTSDAQPYFIETKFFHAKFFNTLHLEYYPFDLQRLSFGIHSDQDPSEFTLEFEKISYIHTGMCQAIKNKGLILEDVYEIVEDPAVVPQGSSMDLKLTVFLKREFLKSTILNLFMVALCVVSLATLALDATIFQCARVELSLVCSWLIFSYNFSVFTSFSHALLNKQNRFFLLLFYLSFTITLFNSFGHSAINAFSNMPDMHHLADAKFPLIVVPILITAILYFISFAFVKRFLLWRSFQK